MEPEAVGHRAAQGLPSLLWQGPQMKLPGAAAQIWTSVPINTFIKIVADMCGTPLSPTIP